MLRAVVHSTYAYTTMNAQRTYNCQNKNENASMGIERTTGRRKMKTYQWAAIQADRYSANTAPEP